MHYLIITFLFVFPVISFAGNKEEWNKDINAIFADSQLTDSVKIIRMAELTFDYGFYSRMMDEEIVKIYLNLTQPLVEKTGSDNLKIYFYKPMFLVSSDPEKAKNFRENYINIIKNSTDPMTRFEGWMVLGHATIDESISLDYLFNALNEVKDSHHYKEQANVYQELSLHYSQKNHTNQLKYALQSVELAKKSGDVRQMIASWKELGTAYYEYPENKYINEALNAYNQALTLSTEKLNIQQFDIHSPESLHYMEILLTIGSIYLAKNQYQEALRNIEAALYIATANDFMDTQAFCHKELGTLYKNIVQYSEAENHYLTAQQLIEIYSRNTTESDHIDYEIQLQLADLYRIMGRYQASASYYETGINKYRKVFDNEMIAENQRTRMYYEALKKERDIEGLKNIVAFKEKQKYYCWILTGVFALILLLIYLLYNYKITIANQHGKQVLDEILLLESDCANADLQTQLKQEEAQLLKHQLTINGELLEHKKQVLENLKKFFIENPELKKYHSLIQNIISRQEHAKTNIENIKAGLQDVPLGFYSYLQNQAENKLTPNDLKYCRMVYLGIPSKEIAEQLFVDIKTVHVNKFRIKQKLGITTGELQTYLTNIIPTGKEDE